MNDRLNDHCIPAFREKNLGLYLLIVSSLFYFFLLFTYLSLYLLFVTVLLLLSSHTWYIFIICNFTVSFSHLFTHLDWYSLFATLLQLLSSLHMIHRVRLISLHIIKLFLSLPPQLLPIELENIFKID